LFLQGSLSGSPLKYYDARDNVTSLWDFSKNPVYSEYVHFNTVYFIISRFKNKHGYVKNLYNIQVLCKIGNKGENFLEVGTGTLLDNVLKIGLTEASTIFGDICYNSKTNIFSVFRYSNTGSLTVDTGEYKVINKQTFEQNTGIKV
jgi:hypothetical protein